MLNRRKNLSHKQRREQLLLKRAVKRGDISPPPALRPDRRVRKPRNPKAPLPEHAYAARKLQSYFIKLPKPFLKRTEILASTLPLARPVAPEAAILPDVEQLPPHAAEEGTSTPQTAQLTCPRRPKWRYDMSKAEIEANEEGLFKKWLAQTDAALGAFCSAEEPEQKQDGQASAHEPSEEAKSEEPEQMPHAPTSFERNLEVYRQLWRVTEISDILLVLLDSRCPTLHFPPALASYLADNPAAARLRTLIVLTKVDISGRTRADAWAAHLRARFPGTRIVQVESVVGRPPDVHGTRRTHEPHLPSAFRAALVEALRETHSELLEPPEGVRANPERLASWKPRVKTQVDWDAVLKAHGGRVGSAVGTGAAAKAGKATSDGHTDEEHTDEESEREFLTVGVIGQPNVGKSSLLNALFGVPKVKTSRTPGKTKHFQTLFWTPEVRLVDCPGLVFPNYVPMETQVLSGILPISRVSAIPLCIHHAAQLLPLERVLELEHPAAAEPRPEYKRTWREGMHPAHAQEAEGGARKEEAWTAMDILTAYADKKGWVTARVGRPDVNRAGNTVLRALAEGRIRWAFWPPGTDPETIRAHQPIEGAGIWLGPAHGQDGEGLDADAEEASEGEDHHGERSDHSSVEGAEDEDEDDDDDGVEEEGGDEDADAAAAGDTVHKENRGRGKLAAATGRFGALVLADASDSEGATEEDEDAA